MKPFLSLLALVIGIFQVTSQVPATDVYAFQLTPDQGSYHIHSPKLLSGLNPGGYTNQPVFHSDEEIFMSVKFPDSTQHDLYAFNLLSERYFPVTQTGLNEFSPKFRPGTGELSYVMQDQHADTMDQRFIVCDFGQGNTAVEYFPSFRDIGYYSWMDSVNVALFITGDQNKLAFGNIETGLVRIFVSNIGRCLQGDDEGNLYYVHKYSEDYWYLKKYMPAEKRSEILVQTPTGSEDFAIGPDGCFFMGSGSSLLYFHPDLEKAWKDVADLAPFGLQNITRLAINSEYQLVVVNDREQTP